MLKIAVQKSDRISKGFLDLLTKCGFKIQERHSKLYYKLTELPIELYFIRGSDIPAMLDSKFDIAILGQDSFMEYNLANKTTILKELDFAKCKMCFAAKKSLNLSDLKGKTIATSYTNILTCYLANKVNANIIKMNGSVETAIDLGLADAIFDIVQTGSTLMQHGLVEFEKAHDLQAIMIAKNNFTNDTLNSLLFRIKAVLNGKPCKYVMFNLKRSLLNNIVKLLPSGKSPTILNLADENYCAIHTLCTEENVWQTCQTLQQNGAEDILITNVDLRFI